MTTRTFFSYATKYDMYDGHKDWSELSSKEQDDIIQAELLRTDIDIEELVMSTGLIKKQAQGLRAILVAVSFSLERAKLIEDMHDWTAKQKDLIIDFLKGTALSLRLSQAFSLPDIQSRQPIDGDKLAQLSIHKLDAVVDMDFREAKEFLIGELEALPNPISSSALPRTDRHLPLTATAWGLDLFEKELSFLKSPTFWVGMTMVIALCSIASFWGKASDVWEDDGQFIDYLLAFIKSVLWSMLVVYRIFITVLSVFIAEVAQDFHRDKRREGNPLSAWKYTKTDFAYACFIGLALFSILYIPCLIVNFLISLVS